MVMEQAMRQQDELALSQLSLRKGLGILGLVLPAVLLLVSALSPTIVLQRSLSAYYYVPHLRDLLVGILWAIGAFLVFYQGYRSVPRAFQKLPIWLSRHLTDTNLTTLAGIGALVTATVPTCEFQDACGSRFMAGIHLAGSVTFLGTLAIMAIWAFTESDTPPEKWGAKKIWSNRIYITCGCTILSCLVSAGLTLGLGVKAVGPFVQPVFWFESIAIWASGIAWLIKGKAIQGLVALLRLTKTNIANS